MMRFLAFHKLLKCCQLKRPPSASSKVLPVMEEGADYRENDHPPVSTKSENDKNNDDNNHTAYEQNRKSIDYNRRKKKQSGLRFEKVISGIKETEGKKIEELKEGIKLQAKSLFRFFSLFVLYTVTGGLIFLYIEECSGLGHAEDSSVPQIGDAEVPAKYHNVTASCLQLYNKLLNSTSNTLLSNSSFEDFHIICKDVVETSAEPHIEPGKPPPTCVWDEFTILKYAEYTIFTLLTIGYGNTTPITTVGRNLAIVYSIGGVPIAVTMYSIAGKLLVQLLTLIVKCFNAKIMKTNYPTKTVKMETFLFSMICVIIIMLIGCGITTREEMENWEFSSSFYFWFISLTTIGYGDLHFDRNRHLANIHFLMLAAGLLLFGLGMVAAVIESFAVFLEKQSSEDDDDEIEEAPCALVGEQIGAKLVESTAKAGLGILLDMRTEHNEEEAEQCSVIDAVVRFSDNVAFENDEVDTDNNNDKSQYHILEEDDTSQSAGSSRSGSSAGSSSRVKRFIGNDDAESGEEV